MVYLYVALYLAVAATLFGALCGQAANQDRDDLKWLILVGSLLWPLFGLAAVAFNSVKKEKEKP
jgi:hypothetical protein